MQFGFSPPVSGTLSSPDNLARIAAEGEAIGYDYATISDHVVIPRDIEAKYPYSDTGEFPGRARGDRHEQLTAVAFVAGKTSRLRLVTSVTVVPHRPAVLLAKGPPLRAPQDLPAHALIHDQAIEPDPLVPTWSMWLKAAGVDKIPPATGLSLNNMHLALDAAVAGHGVVLAQSTIAAADLAAGRLVRLFSLALPDQFAYYIVTAPGALERPKVRAFRDWLRSEADR